MAEVTAFAVNNVMRSAEAAFLAKKGSVHEGGVRVPYFIRWDGRIEPGCDIDRVGDHIDILPTLADLAGARLPPGQVEGRSQLPLLPLPARAGPIVSSSLIAPTGRTAANPDDHKLQNYSVRNQRFRLVNNEALYVLGADPGETQNVAPCASRGGAGDAGGFRALLERGAPADGE